MIVLNSRTSPYFANINALRLIVIKVADFAAPRSTKVAEANNSRILKAERQVRPALSKSLCWSGGWSVSCLPQGLKSGEN